MHSQRIHRIRQLLMLFCCLLTASKGFCNDTIPPAKFYTLDDWKLQIPGPVEIRQLAGFFCNHFYSTVDSAICFQLDASEKGHTPNSEYVRSELRHVKDWSTESAHRLSAKIRMEASADEKKVTVLQIHGINPDHSNAPPLLRIAINGDGLYAFIKTDSSGEHTEKVFLQKVDDHKYTAVAISTEAGFLKIYLDNQLKLVRDIHFWTYLNYFKTGCYPQVKSGIFKVYCKDLFVN